MFSILAGFQIIQGILSLTGEATTEIFPVQPVDGKCPLPDESGTLVDPIDEILLDKLCRRIECINVGDRYFLIIHRCGNESIPQLGKDCTLLETPTGNYPKCCPVYECNSKSQTKQIQKREEVELCSGYTDPRETLICKLSLIFLLSCLKESFETWQTRNTDEDRDVNLSEEKLKFLLKRKRREEDSSDEENDVHFKPELWMEINFCFYYVEAFVNDSLYSEEQVSFSKEISDSEEQEVLNFIGCLEESPNLPTPSDAQIDPRADQVRSHLIRFRRETNDESEDFLTPFDVKIIFALQQCAGGSESKKPVIDSGETQKRQVQEELTSLADFEFFYCLTLHPMSIPVFERELVKEFRKIEDTPKSTMIRIAREALNDHQELTNEEIKAVQEVLECTAVLSNGD